MIWQLLHPRATHEHLGLLPHMVSERNASPAKEQFHRNYTHGGGWRPMPGWSFNKGNATIQYPGDPPYAPIAKTQLRDETIYLYEHAWVLILQPDGTFEISRMD